MPTVAFKTLGCRLNQAETDQMAEDLLSAGYEIVAESEKPDILVVNTCTVTQEATSASRRAAKKAKSDATAPQTVVVAGCYAVAEPDEARSIEGVDLVITNEEKDRIVDLLGPKPVRTLIPLGKRRGFPSADRSRVNLKVQTGCDEHCTFCIIPRTRGPLKSYPLEPLLEEARRKVESGARELVLTGVHLGKYGWDRGEPDAALVALLEGLLEISDLARIRMSSILVRHLTTRVISLIRNEDRICRFLHVPLQAGNNDVLERMNRPYRVEEYIQTIEEAKRQVPGLSLSTDVIVGFPGETAQQFEDTLEVVEQVGFMKLHVFRYSARPGTPSAGWDGQVPVDERKRRSKELIALGNRLRMEHLTRQVGLVREILVEGATDQGLVIGHTDDFVKVKAAGPSALVDRLAKVRLEDPSLESVSGTLVGTPGFAQADPRGVC